MVMIVKKRKNAHERSNSASLPSSYTGSQRIRISLFQKLMNNENEFQKSNTKNRKNERN